MLLFRAINFILSLPPSISPSLPPSLSPSLHLSLPPSLPSSPDWIRQIWDWSFCLPHQPFSDVRLHGQLHPPTETSSGEIHDEQCTRKLHHFAGRHAQLEKQLLQPLSTVCHELWNYLFLTQCGMGSFIYWRITWYFDTAILKFCVASLPLSDVVSFLFG